MKCYKCGYELNLLEDERYCPKCGYPVNPYKDEIYNALSDFINNELKIVLTVKNIKDGYADCEVHFETAEHKNDERGWKVKREVFASELFTILDKTLIGADVKFNADANVIFVENIRIEVRKHHCAVYQDNEFIMSFPGRICFFCTDWEKYRGCRIEHTCANEYGIQIIRNMTLEPFKERRVALTKYELADIKTHLIRAEEHYKKQLYFWEQLALRKDSKGELEYPNVVENIKFLRGLKWDVERLLKKIKKME